MFFSIGLLIVIAYIAYRAPPREHAEDAHVHGAGQVGLWQRLRFLGWITSPRSIMLPAR